MVGCGHLLCEPFLNRHALVALNNSAVANHVPVEQHGVEHFGRAARHIHNKKGYKPEMLADEPVRELIEATNKALVEPLHRLALNEEVSFDLQTALEQNTFVFSGFKTHHELTEAAQLLKGDDGRFKPFSQFRTDIQALNQNYNGNYLRAEYNFATASTQMAAKWQQWAEDGDEYNLQYRTANDDRVREEHTALHGTTLPPSDPFWDSYLPPNGWNCRCTTVQVLKYKYPESDSAKAIAAAAGITDTPKKQIFRFNPGKQMKVFPPKHPYLPKGCGNCGRTLLSYNPNSAQCRACEALKKIEEKPRGPFEIEGKHYGKTWTLEYTNPKSHGYIVREDGHGADEATQNIKSATPLANNGFKVELIKQETIKKDGHKKKIKTRDANVNDEKWEFKYTAEYENLAKSIGTKAGQVVEQGADVMLIDIYKNKTYGDYLVIAGVKNAFKYNSKLQKICVMIESGDYLLVDRVGYEKGTFVKDIKKWLTP